MTFVNVGTLGATPGKRVQLVEILTRRSADLEAAGYLLYEVGVNDEQPDTVFVAGRFRALARAQAVPEARQPTSPRGERFSTPGGQRCCRADGPGTEGVRGGSCAHDRGGDGKDSVVVLVAHPLSVLARERRLALASDALHGDPFPCP